MFSLPKQIPSAFGVLGDNTKLNFKTGAGGIRRLAEERNIAASEETYWSQYLTVFGSASDAFTLIGPHDVYRALLYAPENIATLLRYLIQKLSMSLKDHTFPSPPPSLLNPLNSLPVTFSLGGNTKRDTTKEALNCIRVLSRILPVIFGLENNDIEMALLWKRETLSSTSASVGRTRSRESITTSTSSLSGEQSAPQFVIDDEDELEPATPVVQRTPSNQSHSRTSSVVDAASRQKQEPALAETLITSLIDLLFCCGFTLPAKSQVDHHKIQHIIWERGVGSTTTPAPPSSREQAYLDSNRVESLRLLLVIMSSQIYQSPTTILSTPSKYTEYLVQAVHRRGVLGVLCSCLNVVVNSSNAVEQSADGNSGAAALGVNLSKGLSKSIGGINNVFNGGEDTRDSLVSICVQFLCIILDYQAGSARDLVPAGSSNASPTPSPKTNHFRYFVSRIHRPVDFSYMLDGLLGILGEEILRGDGILARGEGLLNMGVGALSNGVAAIPGVNKLQEVSGVKVGPGGVLKTKGRGYIDNVVVLLWKLLDLNKKFRAFMVEGDRAVDIVAYLACYCLELRNEPKPHGTSRVLAYMIQSITSEPAFGQQVNVPLRLPLPGKWSSNGTGTFVGGPAAEFYIYAIYSLLNTSNSTSGSPAISASVGTVGSAISATSQQSPESNGSGITTAMAPAFAISLANLAPYFKNLSVSAGARMMQLTATFADPKSLLAEEGNPRLLFLMLEALNTILYHNVNQNPQLVYALLRSHRLFENLGTFTLSQGLRDIKGREQEAKERLDRRASMTAAASGKRTARELEEEGRQPHEEKARLLAAESRASLSVSAEGLQLELDRAGPLTNTLLENSLDSMRISSPPPMGTSTSNSSRQTHPAGSSDLAGMEGQSLSEKGKGKLKERTQSVELTASEEQAAAKAVGRNGFVPTQEWVTSWQQGLPLDPILITISDLLPKIQEIQSSMNRPSTSPAILDFLRVVNLAPILPPKPTIYSRPFTWSDASLVWLTSLIWGDIYVKGITPLGIWNGTNVRLFYVKHTQSQQR